MTTARGYWANSPWPGEDGGPRRQQVPMTDVPALGLATGTTQGALQVTSRPAFAATMCVTRQQGELYLLGHTLGGTGAINTTSWVERLHPESLETLRRSDDLAGGPFWPGGMAAHANGSLYVTYGRWCHQLDPYSLQTMRSRELPRDRPYNSLVITDDGFLVMKDIGGSTGGLALPDGAAGSELVVLEPDELKIAARHELPEGSIARLSADGNDVYVVGVTGCHRLAWDSHTLTPDETWSPTYRILDGQTFGWDIVLADGAGWFLDNGSGSEAFGGSFRGKTDSSTPLHLVRVDLTTDDVSLTEVCGREGGLIANPPCVDTDRKIAVGYDSGHGVMTAFRYGPVDAADPTDAVDDDDGVELRELWSRPQDHAGHMVLFPSTGELVSYDYATERGLDQIVVLDIETGDEMARVDTPSPVQCVLFPCAGWERDVYVCTFTTVTRAYVQ